MPASGSVAYIGPASIFAACPWRSVRLFLYVYRQEQDIIHLHRPGYISPSENWKGSSESCYMPLENLKGPSAFRYRPQENRKGPSESRYMPPENRKHPSESRYRPPENRKHPSAFRYRPPENRKHTAESRYMLLESRKHTGESRYTPRNVVILLGISLHPSESRYTPRKPGSAPLTFVTPQQAHRAKKPFDNEALRSQVSQGPVKVSLERPAL